MAPLGAGKLSAEPLNESKQEQVTCLFASHVRPVSTLDCGANLYRVRGRKRNRISPRLSLNPLPPRWSGRAQFVSLGPWPKDTSWGSQQLTTHQLERLRWDWVSRFKTLEIPKEMETWTSRDTDQVVRYYMSFRSGQISAKQEPVILADDDADRLWRNVMLWCLKYRKRQALLLLLATLEGRKYRPPRYVVFDSLEFLARHFLFKVSNPNPTAIEAIWRLTCKFIDGARDQEQNFTIPQQLIYTVLQHSDDSRVLSFFWLLGLNKAVLEANTMLHFLDRFLDMGRINLSMRLLKTIINTGYDPIYDQVQMACVKLLRNRFDTPEEYSIRTKILTLILEMGIRPSLPLFNTIILNAGEGGDFANAWQMYGLAGENDLRPNSVTYIVLLKGAVLSREVSNIDLVFREIQFNGEVLKDLRLLSVVLNAISLKSPGDEFGAMLDFYKQHFDVRPLHDLSLLGDQTQPLPSAHSYGVLPDRRILAQMIVAYLKVHGGSRGLIHIYNRYYQHVVERHPLIASLAQGDEVPNAFILAFGKQPSTCRHCVTVIKHMHELFSQPLATSDTIAYAAPTAQTWSILAGAYFHNGQRRAAEKVLGMMGERGLEFDQVTWNVLISNLAGLQDAQATADAMKGMEAAGFEVDAYTVKGLGNLRMQDRLMHALERNIKKPSAIKGTLRGILPFMDSKEQHEASKTLEQESEDLNRANEVREYWEAKAQEQLDMELEDPSDGLVGVE